MEFRHVLHSTSTLLLVLRVAVLRVALPRRVILLARPRAAQSRGGRLRGGHLRTRFRRGGEALRQEDGVRVVTLR